MKTGKPFAELETELLGGQKLQGVATADELHQFLRANGRVGGYPLFHVVVSHIRPWHPLHHSYTESTLVSSLFTCSTRLLARIWIRLSSLTTFELAYSIVLGFSAPCQAIKALRINIDRVFDLHF